MPYRLGGGDGYIDCIQMVYAALGQMEIPTPLFNDGWYGMHRRGYLRALLRWGKKTTDLPYDGDVLLFDGQQPMFGVVWQQGAIHVNQLRNAVSWCPISQLGSHWRVRYCPTRKS